MSTVAPCTSHGATRPSELPRRIKRIRQEAHHLIPDPFIDAQEPRLQLQQFVSRKHTSGFFHVTEAARVVRHDPQQLRRYTMRGERVIPRRAFDP